jgi:putative lipoprotein
MTRLLSTLAFTVALAALCCCGGSGEVAPDEAVSTPPAPAARVAPAASAGPGRLAGTSWLVRAYDGGGKRMELGDDAALHIAFTDEGTVAGSAGCNRYSGGYAQEGAGLTLGALAVTRMMCAGDGVMEHEAAFLAALGTAVRWEIHGPRLVLGRADGALAVEGLSAVTGTVTYLTRQALAPEARIRVTLEDVSRADAPSSVVVEQTIPAEGKQVPIPFQLRFDPAAIDPRHSYVLRAAITLEGQPILVSTEAHPVITRDAPHYGVEIRVAPLGS